MPRVLREPTYLVRAVRIHMATDIVFAAGALALLERADGRAEGSSF